MPSGIYKDSTKDRRPSEATKRKMAISRMGRFVSAETRKKLSKSNTGKRPTEETRRRQVMAHKGKKLSKEHVENMRKAHIGIYHSEEAKMKMRGEKSSAWKGGITPIHKKVRRSLECIQWRQRVFLRDDFTCQECKKRCCGLHAHHKIPFHNLLQEAWKCLPLFTAFDGAIAYTPLWDIDNGVTLCHDCHRKIHRRAKKC